MASREMLVREHTRRGKKGIEGDLCFEPKLPLFIEASLTANSRSAGMTLFLEVGAVSLDRCGSSDHHRTALLHQLRQERVKAHDPTGTSAAWQVLQFDPLAISLCINATSLVEYCQS